MMAASWEELWAELTRTTYLGCYILDEDGQPVPCQDLRAWAEWRVDHREQARVSRTEVGARTVSTVFLWIDHGWGEGPPVLWETAIFEPDRHVIVVARYRSLVEAQAGHVAITAQLQAGDQLDGRF
jgi:hypothetical protein